MSGLLSPEDDFIQGVATGGSLLTDNPNFRRHPILPLGVDQTPPPEYRALEFAVPQFLANPVDFGKSLASGFEGLMAQGLSYTDDRPIADYEMTPFERATDAGVTVGIDFGALPAAGGALLAPAASNTLRMGAGGGQPKNVREKDDLGFYSEALEQAKMLPMESGTGEQFRSMLLKRGVKPDEIKFTEGLSGLLDQPKVTKNELVGLLREQRLEPFESLYKEGFDDLKFGEPQVLDFNEFKTQIRDPEIHEIIIDEHVFGFYDNDRLIEYLRIGFGDKYDAEDLAAIKMDLDEGLSHTYTGELRDDLRAAANNIEVDNYLDNPVITSVDERFGFKVSGNSQDGFDVYTSDGEYLTTMDTFGDAQYVAFDQAMMDGKLELTDDPKFEMLTERGGDNYQERLLVSDGYEGQDGLLFFKNHFEEPNIAVFSRTKDRKLDDGSSTLYVEEIQSDWGQNARGKFRKGDEAERIKQIKSDNKLTLNAYNFAKNELQEGADNALDYLAESLGLERRRPDPDNYPYGHFVDPETGAIKIQDRYVDMILEGEQPIMDAPNTDLGFRFIEFDEFPPEYSRSMKQFTAAEEAASPILEKIANLENPYTPAPFVGSTDKFTELGIKRLIQSAVREGKDNLSFSTGKIQVKRSKNKGLTKYYDEIIPKVAEKVIKKLDPNATIKMKKVKGLGDRLTIEITPEMRESVEGGIPLFTAPAVPLSGILANDNQTQQQGLL